MKTQIEKNQQQRIYIFWIFTNILLKHSIDSRNIFTIYTNCLWKCKGHQKLSDDLGSMKTRKIIEIEKFELPSKKPKRTTFSEDFRTVITMIIS